MELPPEVRQALLSLLLEAIRELIALMRHVIANLTGQVVEALPLPPL